MNQALQVAATTEQPLDADDLSLLRKLRENLVGTMIFMSLCCAAILCALVWMTALLFTDSRASPVVLVLLPLAVVAGLFLRFHLHRIRLFQGVLVVLRRPQQVRKTVSRGDLMDISSEDGVVSYGLGGEPLSVWIPFRHAGTGVLEFTRSPSRLDGLKHQPVVLERLALAGAPAPLLLRADYPAYPPMVVERASTDEECSEVASEDFGPRSALIIVYGAVWLAVAIGFGLVGVLSMLPVGIAGFIWVKRLEKKWAAIRPRTLTVTGVIVEVFDHPVAVGRYAERQRWYRIGDRLYPTGRKAPEDDAITCGSVVRMDYVDHSPRGGRILRIEPLSG